MKLFRSIFQPTVESKILDVGGFYGFWINSAVEAQITILRPEGAEKLPPDTPKNIVSVCGNGCDLSEYKDHSFDLVFSNSVIEHVGDFERQQAFASEALRVGRSVWCQTPAWEFPLEPHVLTPFIHWLPKRLSERLLPWTVWALLQNRALTPQDYGDVRARLLRFRELEKLFPNAEILVERFFGLPKSYIVWREVE